jgi:hypothetical protein
LWAVLRISLAKSWITGGECLTLGFRPTSYRRHIMRRFHAVGLTGLLIACLFLVGTAGGTQQDKQFEIPKDAISGTVKSVDEKKASFTISPEKGKDRTFLVDDKTEFWGPKGGDRGTGPKGLKDDCMAPGYEIKVMAAKDGKSAKGVYLPVRKGDK